MLRRNKMLAWVLLMIYVIASSLGMVLIKRGGANTYIHFGKGALNVQISCTIMLGLIFYVLSFLLWIYILQLFNLTYISPIAYGITYIFITIFSYIILKESVTREQIVGVIFIVVGIFIANFKK